MTRALWPGSEQQHVGWQLLERRRYELKHVQKEDDEHMSKCRTYGTGQSNGSISRMPCCALALMTLTRYTVRQIGQGSCSGIWWRALETQWQDVSTWFRNHVLQCRFFCRTWQCWCNPGYCKHFPEDDFVWCVAESHSGRRTQRRCLSGSWCANSGVPYVWRGAAS